MSASTDSYSNLLGGMWAPKGSEMDSRLRKLHELEQKRKDREAKRRELMGDAADTGSVRRQRVATSVRPSRANRLNSQDSSTANQTTYTRYSSRNADPSQGYVDQYGGARPKFALTSAPDSAGDMSSIFSNFTDSLLNNSSVVPRKAIRTRIDSDDSSSYASGVRSRLGSADSEDSYSSSRLGSNSGTRYGNHDRSYKNRYEPPPEENFSNCLSNVTASILGKSKSTSYQPKDRDYNFSNILSSGNNTYGNIEQQFEGEQMFEYPDGQVETQNYPQFEPLETDETFEEPADFLERLNRENSENTSSSENFHHKRSGSYGQVSSMPILLPTKRSNSDTEVNNPDECEDVPDQSQTGENILAVANDIHTAFGRKSPRMSETGIRADYDLKNEGFDFSSSANGEGENIAFMTNDNLILNGESNRDISFTATLPVAPKRTNSKRNNSRGSVKGNDQSTKQPETTTSASNETNPEHGSEVETSVNLATNETKEADKKEESFRFEIVEMDDEGLEDENPDLLQVRKSLYHANSGDWAVADQTPGKLDMMQEYFSGQKVEGDPKITRLLNGRSLRGELDKSIHENLDGVNKNVTSKTVEGSNETKKKFAAESVGNHTKTNGENENMDIKTPKKKAPGTPNVWDRLSKPSSKTTNDRESLESNKSDTKSRTSDIDTESTVSTSGSESESVQRQKDTGHIQQIKKATKNKQKSNVNDTVDNNVDTSQTLSLDDKLTKLQSMTTEIIRRHSANEDDIADVANRINAFSSARSTPSSRRPLSSTTKQGSKSVTDKSTTRPRLETQKSSKDLVKDLKIYVHENVSPRDTVPDPAIQKLDLNSQPDTKSKMTEEIGIQTDVEGKIDNFVLVYICKHCGKSSEDEVVEKHVNEANNAMKESEANNAMKENVQVQEKKDMKPKVTGQVPSYMQSTKSSIHKYSKPPASDKPRKSSMTDETSKQCTYATNNTRNNKGMVSQRINAFDNTCGGKSDKINRKVNKRGLSVFSRENSLDRQGETTVSSGRPNIENIHSKLNKSKSWDQIYIAESLSGRSDRTDKPDKVDGVVNTEIRDTKSKVTSAGFEIGKQVVHGPGENRKHTAIVMKVPPPVSPKPVRKVPLSTKIERKTEASKRDTSAVPSSPRTSLSKSISNEDERELSKSASGRTTPVGSSGRTTPGISSRSSSPVDCDANVESHGIFTKLEDSPFIKNDSRRRSSKGRKDGESVWEKSSLNRENSRSSESLKRSHTSRGERASLTRLSWSGSGSSGSFRGSSLHGSDPNLAMGSPLRRSSSETILATGSSHLEKNNVPIRRNNQEPQPSTPAPKNMLTETQPSSPVSKDMLTETQPSSPVSKDMLTETQPSTPAPKDMLTETQPSTPAPKNMLTETQPSSPVSKDMLAETQPSTPAPKDMLAETQPSTPAPKDMLTSETDIDEAFKNFNDSKNNSQLESTEIDEETDKAHSEFAHKVNNMLNSESKSGSDIENPNIAVTAVSNAKQKGTTPNIAEQKVNDHAETNGVHVKSKKGFFKGKLFKR